MATRSLKVSILARLFSIYRNPQRLLLMLGMKNFRLERLSNYRSQLYKWQLNSHQQALGGLMEKPI